MENVSQSTVSYRCLTCRHRYSVFHGHPLLEGQGHGGLSPSLAVFAWWNWVEDVSLTATARQLNLGEAAVRRLFDLAAVVCAEAAVGLQSTMVFGSRGSQTTEVEVDETCVSSWTVHGETPELNQNYWYCWVGACQRGDLTKLWLAPLVQSPDLPLGVSLSRGAEPRVPPLSLECWRRISLELFKESSNVILMTDSAAAYGAIVPQGVVEHHTVNHSQKEFSRSVEVLADVTDQTRRPGMAGTMSIDRAWKSLKERLPQGGLSCKTDRGRQRTAVYIRAAQWKRLHSTADRWPLFAGAVAAYVAKHRRRGRGDAVAFACAVPEAARAKARRRLRCKTAAAPAQQAQQEQQAQQAQLALLPQLAQEQQQEREQVQQAQQEQEQEAPKKRARGAQQQKQREGLWGWGSSLPEPAGLLGPPAAGVPAELHAEMEKQAAAGNLPLTTPEQRERSRLTGGDRAPNQQQ